MPDDSASKLRPQVLLHEWMRLLFGVLDQLGAQHAVVSPGSRNAPLIHGALRQGNIKCHSVLDERVAGFFALGLARASRTPVVLICTSGSAVAHYFPAVIEAHQSGVPLYVISADRPSRLQACGAPQTIDQVGIFGSFARSLAGWDEASAEPRALGHWARKVAQLYQLALGPSPGPVHLNVPLDKPLEPWPPASEGELELARNVDVTLASLPSCSAARVVPTRSELERFIARFAQSSGAKWISVGPVEPHVARLVPMLAAHWGLPVVSELPALAGAWSPESLARAAAQGTHPSPLQTLHIGPPLVSARWSGLVTQSLVKQWVVPGPTYFEPSAQATSILLGDLALVLEGFMAAAAPTFAASAAPLPERAPQQASLAEQSSLCQPGCMSEPGAVHCVLRSVKRHHQLLLANSLSLRLAAWVQSPGLCHAPSYTSRGANGIDGWIAQASGVASATSAPTLVLLGDVAAAHDLSALAVARSSQVPLVICVLDNQGGRIFEHLPGAQLWPEQAGSAEFFLTPPRVDWTQAAAAYSVPATVCSTLDELGRALEGALGRPGASLVVARTDPQTTHHLLRGLAEASP